ncbi:protein STRUBBELIG-RECEPTOR FAMILY 3-like [Salvia miltiorrhiza]|uniref:protein STRUBBELIG-RECEPTOR FAMILY 3-like n=1 Tax=Salvia miltiorrhiza TaxID=226208 RepID=UPI0025AB9BF0|nr:protein STRUBBELIG-RECEPTOR FAMILY 3-like [Salvia miltiorrhiza]XP_057764535.1 protein STRUBBELIG-RECEPTOR FAMILY 3-like [Salvia miltiorrhiza]XP_057764536.1 protein STRUBBELIG-RECEPTOR FAMILY 3-like [Salvia miltiorrhiza]XP_057764537.1 protein STRUBBELIG-RECEPTOR FAMILY 3-like [Salvia miltiorrhiza]
MMARSFLKIDEWVLCLFILLSAVPFHHGFTDPRDVFAITQLHASLGLPLLPGWIPGGDPCGPPSWQGVECVNANITALKLSSANLGGELPEDLGMFASIIDIDLSNNHIGGSIPTSLPITLQNFFLSDNQFTGDIPNSLSSLGQLKSLSLNNNQLTGAIPDAFEPITGLINMDLSWNSLTGVLPPSMRSLLSLTSLHLQNNQLIGVLDVIQDLPLTDLNVENNLFSGPIPGKLLNIPSFRRAGNPFNTTILPSPPASPPVSPTKAPSPQLASSPGSNVHGQFVSPLPQSGGEKKNTSNKITWIAVGGLVLILVLVLGLFLSISRCCKGRRSMEKIFKSNEVGYGSLSETHKQDETSQFHKVPQGLKKVDLQPAEASQTRNALLKQGKDHSIDMTGLSKSDPRPSPLPFPLLPAERIAADPTFTSLNPTGSAGKIVESVKLFTIGMLQQYTNSFSQENLIGKGMLGTVYSAQLPKGKVLAVKKLDKAASVHLNDQEFLDLVSSISNLRHANIVELVGYCLEHGERLLVYNYCGNGTLDEALNLDDEINKKLSWNTRMILALQAAKALEYLHETRHPPIMHRNFKSCNLLLNDDLSVQVSDCGLASLMPANSIAQLQNSGYGAPELDFGSYSYQSDVYSFGVVMLRLLTGRKAYDRSRPRGEQYLVRWAFTQLYDIDALSRMVDPSLKGAYPSKSLSRVADIISLCIQPEPEFRPPMSEIVQKLVSIIQRHPNP